MRNFGLAALFVLVSNLVWAQATATFNGRVTDESGLAIPGATVTATNTATGVTRTTVTNDSGLYSLPALQPSVYDIDVELAGFQPASRRAVTLTTDTALTIDFTLRVAAVAETLTVTGQAPLVETTRSDVSGSIQLSELQSLPMLDRNFTGLVALLPGARPAPTYNTTKRLMGSGISFSGGGGRNVLVNVDGLDNRDDMIGGPLQTYTIEGMQEFKLLSHQFAPQYGRSSGAVLQIVSKSGGNRASGSAFLFGRNDAMTAIDYFTKAAGRPKNTYDRQQFGGSLGGPIVHDRWFVFGAVERMQQDYVLTVPDGTYQQGLLFAPYIFPAGSMKPTQTIPQPVRDNMVTVKTDYNANSAHALMVRYGLQRNTARNDQWLTNRPDLGHEETQENDMWSVVAGHTWVIGNNSLNQFGIQRSHYTTAIEQIPAGPDPVTTIVTFPSFVTAGRAPGTDQHFVQDKYQIKNDFSQQIGSHALKFGGEFSWFPEIAIRTNILTCGGMTFFDDPATIINNTNGRYPHGFQTPGIVSNVTVGTCSAGGGEQDSSTLGQKHVGLYAQDDWKATRQLTLNFGVRYDLPINFYNQREGHLSRTYRVLSAIGSPYGRLPQMPTTDIAPRVGFAWDLAGDGRSVLRGGFGLFFDHNMQGNTWQANAQMKRTLTIASAYVNTAPGVGQLANYVYGTSPLPPGPPAFPTELPVGGNTNGILYDPDITDPYTRQFHVGYTRQMSDRSALSADFTHIDGFDEFRPQQINPILGPWDPTADPSRYGQRRLAQAFANAFGDPRILGSITMTCSCNESQFDEFIVHYEHRGTRATFQASYTLARAYAYGGQIANIAQGGGPAMQAVNQDQLFGPGEWGPASTDERHRVVFSAVLELPWGIQASPVFQAGSARPYNLLAGRDLNADGVNNDRYVDPATGRQVSVNSARGEPTYNADVRVTKFFDLGGTERRVGVFAELYNITNKANFANNVQGTATSRQFQQPIGYLNGLPQSRQLQIGARFSF